MSGEKQYKPKIINVPGIRFNIDIDEKEFAKLIILPNYFSSEGLLPSGTVLIFERKRHHISSAYLGPDIGNGMLLAKFLHKPVQELKYITYILCGEIQWFGPCDFITFYKIVESEISGIRHGDLMMLIHSGRRQKIEKVSERRDTGESYRHRYKLAVAYGKRNRKKLLNLVEECSETKIEIIFDLPHNLLEVTKSHVIYRKGAFKLKTGNLGIIPSSASGNAIIVRAKPNLKELNWSICHGTGRKLSRERVRQIYFDYTSDSLLDYSFRDKIYIPGIIPNDSIIEEHPDCFKALEEVIPFLEDYVEIVAVLSPIACVL